jgi:hypothetical protein
MEMSLNAKEVKNAYQRAWRRKNVVKMRNYNAKYWNKRAMIREGNKPGPNPDLVDPLTPGQRCTMNDIFQDLKSRSDV